MTSHPMPRQDAVAEPTGPRERPVRRLGRRPALDGFRGLAVLLVICDHAHVPFSSAWIGVDLFFVLSGFLITSLLMDEYDRKGRVSLRAFYVRRARRLLPGLALLTLGVAAVSLTIHQLQDRWVLWAQILTTWTFSSNAVVWLAHAPIGAFTSTWSLACEEQFYLLWPVSLLLLRRRGWSPVRITLALGTTVLVLAFTAWTVTEHVATSEAYFSPIGREGELLLGCALAVAWRYGLVPRLLERSGLPALLAVVFGGWLVVQTPLGTEATYFGAAVCGVVVMTRLLARDRGVLNSVFSFAPLRYTGRVSYGLYLYNDAVSRLLHHNLPGRPWWVIGPLLLVGSFACASLSYHLVEERFLRRPASRQRAAEQSQPAVGAAADVPVTGAPAGVVPGAADDGAEESLTPVQAQA